MSDTDPYIVEVDMPGNYLVVNGDKITTTSDGTKCTQFTSYKKGMAAANKYYGGRERFREPHVFQPDWLKKKGTQGNIKFLKP